MACRSLMFPAGPVNETLPTPPNVAPGCPKQLELSLYLIPFRRYCDFKIRPQAVFRTFPCGEKAISKVFGRPTLGARSLMFPAGPVNETLPTPPNVAPGCPKQLELSLYLIPFRRYCDFKIRPQAVFRTFPCGEKAISKVFGRPTLGARSLMFPAGPVNETLPTPPNVARGFPTHLEWSLYLLPFRRYRDFKIRP